MKIIALAIFLAAGLTPQPAQALFFTGGAGDGTAFATGDARSWGFFGGSGRGDVLIMTGTQTVMTFTSAATQTFTVGDTPTAHSAMTVQQDLAVGSGVTTANGIRITIPAELDMLWDTSDTSAAIGGAAAAKVSADPPNTAVSYADGGRTLVIPVITNFADGDAITVSGLAFSSFAVPGGGYLKLDITGSAAWLDTDLMDKYILIASRSSGFLGGDGRGESLSDNAQSERVWGFPGGSGRGDVMRLAASMTLMTFTSAAQSFTHGDGSTAASSFTITQDVTAGTGVLATVNMRIVIPSALGMSWDTSKNWAALTVTGGASGKVSDVSYPDSQTMVLDVTDDFDDGDTITVSGLAFEDFDFASVQSLLLDISGTGAVYEPDLYEKTVLVASRTAGFLGGSGRGETVDNIYLIPGNVVEFGTLF